jgi:molybdenum cofactor cytidylyltransferase
MTFSGMVLCAGHSRRAGVFKPAFVYEGKPLVAHAIEGMQPWCGRIAVVTGWRQAEVAALVRGTAQVTLVDNPHFAAGMFTSVQAGLWTLDEATEGVFVLPVDCPLVTPDVYRQLTAAFATDGARRSIVPTCGGRGGHPVLLSRSARMRALAAPPDSSLRAVLREVEVRRFDLTDASILVDLDTPADLDALAAGKN